MTSVSNDGTHKFASYLQVTRASTKPDLFHCLCKAVASYSARGRGKIARIVVVYPWSYAAAARLRRGDSLFKYQEPADEALIGVISISLPFDGVVLMPYNKTNF
jgi:hypothetical protein